MIQFSVNWEAVIFAAIAQFFIGWLWYSPVLFAKPWMAARGVTAEQAKQGGSGTKMLLSFVGSIVTAYVLSRFVLVAGAVSADGGARVGFWAWLGFVATLTLSAHLFEGRRRALWFITNGYWLLSLIVMGGILAAWH